MKVLVVAGSSGGHIFPALALLEYLRINHVQVDSLLVLPKKNIKKDAGVTGFRTEYIDSVSLGKKINYRNLLAAFKFLKSSWQSLIIILRFNPEVVVAFGSIAAVPLVVFGWLMRIKVILHEQNVVVGQANRFLTGFCDRIAVSFQESRPYLQNCADKVVFTGNPLRRNLVRLDKTRCREFFVLEENKFTVLVMGGSQGSLRINQAFLKALSDLPFRENLQVIHLAGSHNETELQREYARIKVKARIFPFLDEMEYAYGLADLAVCRAGATSIQELIHYRLPAVLLPYPFAYQHQMANAKVLEDSGAAVVLEDRELDSDRLKNILGGILSDPLNLEKMRSGFLGFKPTEAAGNLAELVLGRFTGHG